jgi:CheY-specific phosphatase CheX
VEEDPPPTEPSPALTYGIIRLASFDESRRLAITFYAGRDSVEAMSMRMLQMEEERSATALELAHSSLAEVLNIIAGRINNSLDEEGREFCIGFPTVEERSSPPSADEPKNGFTIGFTAGENIHFSIGLSMDRLTKARIAASALTDAMVLADTVDAGGAKLAKGLKLNREHIAAIEKARVEEIEVFDPF